MLDVSEYTHVVTTHQNRTDALTHGWITNEHKLIGVDTVRNRDTATSHERINVFGVPRIYMYKHYNYGESGVPLSHFQRDGWEVYEIIQTNQEYVTYILRQSISNEVVNAD